MTVGGKRGNPKPGFPLFPPPLEIAGGDSHIPTGPTILFILTQGGQTPSGKSVTHVAGLKCHLCPRPYMPTNRPVAALELGRLGIQIEGGG
jgi:hypothetical protein